MIEALLAGGSAAAGLGGAVLGWDAQRRAGNKASNIYNQNRQMFMDIDVPTLEQLQLQRLSNPEQLAALLEMEQVYSQAPTEYGNISEDSRLRQAQLDALQTMSRISSAQGMDPQARAAFEMARLETDRDSRSRREAALMNAQARGVAGSGLELAASLQADQDAATRQALAGTQAAAAASQRQLEALQGMANLGGSVRNADFEMAARRAEAQDAINRFNTSNRQDVMGRNVQTRNNASQFDLANRQRINELNTGFTNQERMENRMIPQQRFDNQLRRAAGASGQGAALAGSYLQQGQNQANLFGNLGQGLMQFGGSLYRDRKKEDE